MKIVKWLSPSHSNKSASALIRVEPGEAADIEQMLILIDGDSAGHFGVKAELVKTGEEEPTYTPTMHRGWPLGDEYVEPEMQFGFNNASSMRKEARYYKVYVARD